MKKIIILLVCTLIFSYSFVQAADSATVASPQNFSVDVATQSYLNQLSTEQKASSDGYFEGGYWLQLWNLLYGFGIAFIFLRMGLSKQLKRIASKVKKQNLQNLIYIMLYLLLSWLLSLPFSIYQDYYREHQYGLLNLDFGSWLIENMEGLAINMLFFAPMLMLLYVALRKTGKNWWIWGAGGALVFMAFVSFIAPVFIAPIFNKYEPLEEGELRTEILSMARANGIPADNVYRFDASKQTKKVSANVSGFANTTRISLNDNLINRCSKAEIKAVMGHEMGHYVLNHVYANLLQFGLLILLVLALVNWLLTKLIQRYGSVWDISSMSDIGSLPLLMLAVSFVFFFATPISNTIIRTHELEADYYGLNAAAEPDGFAQAAIMLSEYRKLNPGKWEEIFFFDHPSGRVRVYNAMRWKAEHLK
jgi:STE24 endopeptidase